VDPNRRFFLRRAVNPAAEPARAPAAGPLRVAVSDRCLAQRHVECRICAELCDTRALRFRPASGGISQLVIDLAACTGCGDCVAPCPVGAISLKASPA
jgi:ferredoxin-type protein NapF